MHVIVDKATRAVLHMASEHPGEAPKPEDLMPGFDPATMVLARAPDDYVPVRFEIDKAGVLRDLDAPPPDKPKAETLAEARARRLLSVSRWALSARAEFMPDYELLNAGLGLYDDARTATIKATVQAFRAEYHRVEALINKARSVKEVDAIEPSFPTAPVTPAQLVATTIQQVTSKVAAKTGVTLRPPAKKT